MYNEKSLTGINRILAIIAVAVIYIVAARLGLIFALQPGYATSVWPPSGISVASLLLIGYPIWPGISIGAFFTNLLISSTSVDPISSVLISSSIAIGSTLQPLAIVYVLKKLMSIIHLLNTHRNVFIFLFTTVIGCLIASTIGTTTLYAMGVIELKSYLSNWETWWLGDIMGIYIFTPLLMVWARQIEISDLLKRGFEASLLILITMLIDSLIFEGWLSKNYPIEYMIIPCLLWAVFRFGAKGATLLLFVVSMIAVLGTAHGTGPFVQKSLNDSLLLLQVFIGIITGTTLTLIAVLNESNHTYRALEEHSQDLENEVDHRTTALQRRTLELQDKTILLQDRTLELQKKTEALQNQNLLLKKTLAEHQLMQKRALAQETLASLGTLSTGIGHQLKEPLDDMINCCELSQALIKEMTDMVKNEAQPFEIQNDETLSKNFAALQYYIQKIYTHSKGASRLLERMLAHASKTGEYESVDFNELIKEFLMIIHTNRQREDPTLNIKLDVTFDHSIQKIKIMPSYLVRALIIILNNAYDSVLKKKKEINGEFVPAVSLRTLDMGDRAAIIVRDNGIGFTEEDRANLFAPLISSKSYEDSGLGLSIVYDLIVQNHGGELTVDSKGGQFAEFTIILPKQEKTGQL